MKRFMKFLVLVLMFAPLAVGAQEKQSASIIILGHCLKSGEKANEYFLNTQTGAVMYTNSEMGAMMEIGSLEKEELNNLLSKTSELNYQNMNLTHTSGKPYSFMVFFNNGTRYSLSWNDKSDAPAEVVKVYQMMMDHMELLETPAAADGDYTIF